MINLLAKTNTLWIMKNLCNHCPMKIETWSGRERGLHQRAVRSGVAFPCPISWITLPMKVAPDDDTGTYDLTQWPVLLPSDFAS